MAILVFSPNGTYVTKPTLEAARTSADCAGKTVVVTSALTAAQSDITAAWPVDRALEVKKGGSIGNTATFTINSPFTAGLYQVFAGSGAILFGDGAITGILPEWFGSNGTEIQQALNVADASTVKTVQLAAKTYQLINSPLLIGSKSRLVGAGRGKTLINLTIGGALDSTHLRAVITNKNYPYTTGQVNNQTINLLACHLMTSNTDIIISDLSINGNKTGFAISIWGISFWSVTDVQVINVEVFNTSAQSIMFTGATRPAVTNCIVHDTSMDGIHLQDVFDGIVSNNSVYESSDYGIEIASGYLRGNDAISTGYTTVAANTINKCNNYGIAIRGLVGLASDTDGLPYNPNGKPLYGVTVIGNTIRNTTGGGGSTGGVYSGIGFKDVVAGALVTSNIIDNSGSFGILIAGSSNSYSNISNNTISNSGVNGIYSAAGSLQVSITSNLIIKSAKEGLVGTFLQSIISSNIFVDNNTSNTLGAPLMTFTNSNYVTISGNTFKLGAGDTGTNTLWSRTNSGQFRFVNNTIPTATPILVNSLTTGDFVSDPYTAGGNGFGVGVITGSGTPYAVVTPNFTGQEYFDTATGFWWKSGTNTSGGWGKITN